MHRNVPPQALQNIQIDWGHAGGAKHRKPLRQVLLVAFIRLKHLDQVIEELALAGQLPGHRVPPKLRLPALSRVARFNALDPPINHHRAVNAVLIEQVCDAVGELEQWTRVVRV